MWGLRSGIKSLVDRYQVKCLRGGVTHVPMTYIFVTGRHRTPVMQNINNLNLNLNLNINIKKETIKTKESSITLNLWPRFFPYT